ncbi:hypothetical protein [Corallococcus carmarthensis]|uniref:hypothetical protein n=1 Tax=Corallococcus carmarthensis TaxID=2316728 RepID=UPI00148C6169|nr:hypothetical protein [Corallococcus carmarthensis]NOK15735.1 hypothetical protein [Corallococcus carmarthensis]
MAGVKITVDPITVAPGEKVTLTASPDPTIEEVSREYIWSVTSGHLHEKDSQTTSSASESREWILPTPEGASAVMATATVTLIEYHPDQDRKSQLTHSTAALTLRVEAKNGEPDVKNVVRETLGEINSFSAMGQMPVLSVALQRTQHLFTFDLILWMIIRKTTNWLSFGEYSKFIDEHFCPDEHNADPTMGAAGEPGTPRNLTRSKLRLPFPGVDAYRKLKALTDTFMLARTGVLVDFDRLLRKLDPSEEGARIGQPLPSDSDFLIKVWNRYLENVNGSSDGALPYLAIIRNKLPDVPLINPQDFPPGDITACFGIIQKKLSQPTFLELIWSYWHEEGMQIQAMNYISQRFQNVRGPGDRDPLATLEIDALRPLNNLLWGYIQDEQHRLSVVRRANEYEHEYGFTLHGKAVTGLRTVDRRSKFLESFHNLLHKCVQFFRQDDDTTVVSDGFPVLNAIKETHYLLAQGAHNQFGDMPSTARQEMLMQQWLLSRPEMREFLGGRVMVPYPEPWMDRVDAMKSLLGWTDVSVVHFHDLAVFGEQVLLSLRYGGWSATNDPNQAANWARYWRAEIQGYVHAYRAVTGVDLSADITDQKALAERYVAPSVHLRNRLALQQRQ